MLVTAVAVAGDLGQDVRVLAAQGVGSGLWSNGEWRNWLLVGKGRLRPHWRKPALLRLQTPVPVAAADAATADQAAAIFTAGEAAVVDVRTLWSDV